MEFQISKYVTTRIILRTYNYCQQIIQMTETEILHSSEAILTFIFSDLNSSKLTGVIHA